MNQSSSAVDWPRLLGDIAYLIGEEVPGTVLRVPAGTRALSAYLSEPDDGRGQVVSRGAIRNWLDGSEPKHAEGEWLLAVWCRLSGKPEAYAPITVRTPSPARLRPQRA